MKKTNYTKRLITMILSLSMLISSVAFSLPAQVQAATVALNATSISIMERVYNTYQLKLNNATGKVTWKSSDTGIAKVSSNGLVTAVGTGKKYNPTCTITATYKNKKYKCTVKVFYLKRIKEAYKKNGVTIKLYEGLYNTDGGKAKYYAAHVVLEAKAYGKMHLSKANGKRSNGFQTISKMIKKNNNKAYNAVLAVNGPFNGGDSNKWDAFLDGHNYSIRDHDYREIYGGKYAAGKLGGDEIMKGATYSSKTGYLRPGTEQKGVTSGMTVKTAASQGLISDTFFGDMGSTVLVNGKVQGTKNKKDLRPRTFIGTNGGAGNFWIVVANGDNADGYSSGLNMYGCGTVLKRLHCKYGYNLDGGASSTMVYLGEVINKQSALRTCYDALYVAR